MPLPLELALITKLLNAVGIDPEGVLADLTREKTDKKMDVDAVVADMEEDGLTIKKLQPGGLGPDEKKELIRGAQFRLWRLVFSFKGGGHIADAFRDKQQPKIVTAVEGQIDAGTKMTELVEAVKKATLDLTF